MVVSSSAKKGKRKALSGFPPQPMLEFFQRQIKIFADGLHEGSRIFFCIPMLDMNYKRLPGLGSSDPFIIPENKGSGQGKVLQKSLELPRIQFREPAQTATSIRRRSVPGTITWKISSSPYSLTISKIASCKFRRASSGVFPVAVALIRSHRLPFCTA